MKLNENKENQFVNLVNVNYEQAHFLSPQFGFAVSGTPVCYLNLKKCDMGMQT